MKKLINVLIYLFTGLILLVSFVMTVIETRLLFSGDFLLCHNVFNGFIRYFLRLIISISFLLISFIELFKLVKKSNFLLKHLYFIEILLFISSIVILIFGTNYVGIVCFILYGIFIILKTIQIFRK